MLAGVQFWVSVTPFVIFFLADFTVFKFFCLLLPFPEHGADRVNGGRTGRIPAKADKAVFFSYSESIYVL